MLNESTSRLHDASTRYTLVAKAATPGADDVGVDGLASELLCGTKLLGASCLLLFSPGCGMCCPLRMYARQYVRGPGESITLLVRHFVGRRESRVVDVKDGSEGARRAGAVWDACDKIKSLLWRGNRSTMRRCAIATRA